MDKYETDSLNFIAIILKKIDVFLNFMAIILKKIDVFLNFIFNLFVELFSLNCSSYRRRVGAFLRRKTGFFG